MAFLCALVSSMRAVDGTRLLFASLNWDNLFASASPPGAPRPQVAQASYTRLARRQQIERRRALRSGRDRFLDALR